MRFFYLIFLSSLFLASLVGCSLFGGKSETPTPTVSMAEREEAAAAPAMAKGGFVERTTREPSSLWTDRSKWNDFYGSGTSGRKLGDIILLRPTDAFRHKVVARAGKTLGNNENARGNEQLAATVRDILPNRVLVVEAKQGMAIGARDHDIELTAKVRESDLAADDSTSTDQIFDVNLKVEAGEEVAKAPPPAKNDKVSKDREREHPDPQMDEREVKQ